MSGLLAVAALSVTAGVRAQEARKEAAGADEIPCAAEQAKAAPQHTAASEKADVKASRDDRISIEASDAQFGVKGDATLKGNVVIKQGDREIHANDAQYSPDDTALKIEGELEYLDPVVRVQGRGGNYAQSTGADFKDAEFQLRQRAARGTAESLSVTPQGVVNLEDVKFTTCPREDEAWRIRAKSIVLDTRSKIGTGRNARVDFKGVPIIYLPWMSFPLGNERKSGFLFPSLGHSTRSGFQFSVPYYWNIAPQMDLSFEPVYYALRGADLAGQFRYLTQRQRGSLEFNYLPNDQKTDDSRYRFAIDHIAELPRDFRLTVNAATVSDRQYFEDFAQGPEGTSVPFVERFAQLRYRDEHWMLAAELQNFQTMLMTVQPLVPGGDEFTVADKPYARLPRLVASGDFGWGPAQRLRYGFDSELVNFHRPFGITGWRLDATPSATLSLGNSAYFLRPSVAWRTTQYQLDHTSPAVDDSPSRSLPIASLDAGMFFERPSGSHRQRIMTLEPRLLYLYVPYRGQNDLPVFDTALPDLSLIQLFRTNRYVGADRVSDANQVSLGVTSRLLSAASGQQYLAATFGQILYFDTPRVHLPDEAPREGDDSDLVAQISLTAFKNWSADIGLQRNLEDTSKERAQVRLQYHPGPQKVVNASYRFQRDRLEQGDISAAWPLSKHWNLFTRYVHSFDDHKALERFAGLEYSSCCWRLRVLGRRFITNRGDEGSRTGEQDTGIYLQLELTGLASVGSAADAFLSNAIRGYRKDDSRR
jgi:LPS-assembly protein